MVHTHLQLYMRVLLMKRGKEGRQESGCERFDAAKANCAALTVVQFGEELLALLQLFHGVSDIESKFLARWGQCDAFLVTCEKCDLQFVFQGRDLAA